MLSEALQRNAKHEARLSNISGSLRVPRTTDTILRFAQNDTVYGSDHSELHSPGFADHVLIPRRISDDDLAHRNQTNASCDAQISVQSLAAASFEPTLEITLAREYKGWRVRGEVELPARLKMAGGVGEATCAACHVRGFMVVEHLPSVPVGQIPLESAVDFVAVGRKPVKAANVWTIIVAKIVMG